MKPYDSRFDQIQGVRKRLQEDLFRSSKRSPMVGERVRLRCGQVNSNLFKTGGFLP